MDTERITIVEHRGQYILRASNLRRAHCSDADIGGLLDVLFAYEDDCRERAIYNRWEVVLEKGVSPLFANRVEALAHIHNIKVAEGIFEKYDKLKKEDAVRNKDGAISSGRT